MSKKIFRLYSGVGSYISRKVESSNLQAVYTWIKQLLSNKHQTPLPFLLSDNYTTAEIVSGGLLIKLYDASDSITAIIAIASRSRQSSAVWGRALAYSDMYGLSFNNSDMPAAPWVFAINRDGKVISNELSDVCDCIALAWTSKN